MPPHERSAESPISISFDEVEQFIGCRVHVENGERVIPYGMPIPFTGDVVLKELRAEDPHSKTFLVDDKEHSFVKIMPTSHVSFLTTEPIKKHIIDLKRHIMQIRAYFRQKRFELGE